MANNEEKLNDTIAELLNGAQTLSKVLPQLAQLADDASKNLPESEREKMTKAIKDANISKSVGELSKAIDDLKNIQSRF